MLNDQTPACKSKKVIRQDNQINCQLKNIEIYEFLLDADTENIINVVIYKFGTYFLIY